MTKHFAFLLAWLVFIPAAMAVSSDQSDAGVEFFEKKIRPVLAEHCHKCHSHKAEKLKAGKVSSRAAIPALRSRWASRGKAD